MLKKLYINNHTLQRADERAKNIISEISEKNENFEIKIINIIQSKNGNDIVKEALIVNNYIMPLRVFEKDGIYYYKILSILNEMQFFSSVNLNFGTHTKPKVIRFNEILMQDKFFDKSYNDINKNIADFSWIFPKVENAKKYKEIIISKKFQKNYFMKLFKLPVFIKSFSGLFLKVSQEQ